MVTISKGIKLFYGETELTNLQEISDLGGNAESIEITTLADSAHMYTDGILNYGDSLDFKFLYEKAQFVALNALEDSQEWKVELPDGATCTFGGTCSVKLDGVGVNAALTYTLSIKPDSAMVWA
jgi:hypothetical protein